jgi:2-methylcitrate dehydratase PrpD
MNHGFTVALARFVAGFRFEDLPQRAVLAARTGFADCIGVMVAGGYEAAPCHIAKCVPTVNAGYSAPQIPGGRALSAGDAALVNGTAAHVLDYDDVAINGHPSAVLVPAILASGWQEASGADAIAAYVAGYEVWACLASLETSHLHERGFHPTAIYGAVAAAAACARLAGLDQERTAHSMAIAASMASGLVGNFGTMTKALHIGRAAQSGVLAATLARGGFTGAIDVLEHVSGFMRAHHQTGLHPPSTAELPGRHLRIEETGVNVKRYPTCYATHRAIDAILGIAATQPVEPTEVAELRVETGATQMVMLRNSEPKTALEAKFSMQFALACALSEGKVGLAELDDALVCRPDIIDLMRKVSITTTRETMDDLPFAPQDRLAVVFVGGRIVHSPPIAHAKGSWRSPMSDEEFWVKFRDCTTRSFASSQADVLFAKLNALESLDHLCRLDVVTQCRSPATESCAR